MKTRVVSNQVRRAYAPRFNLVQTGKKFWAAQTAGTFALREDGASTSGGGQSAEGAFYLDPADTPDIRLRAAVLTNNVAPACNFTFRMKPLGTPTGAASIVGNDTGQSVTTGAQVAINTPAANTATFADSGDFTVPSAGFYVVEVVLSANMAASSAAVNRFWIGYYV